MLQFMVFTVLYGIVLLFCVYVRVFFFSECDHLEVSCRVIKRQRWKAGKRDKLPGSV